MEAEKEEMLDLEGNLEAQSEQLKKMIAEKESAVEDFQAKLSQAKVLANKYKQTINEQNAAIAKQEKIISAEKERQRQEELRRAAEEAARRAAENGSGGESSSGENNGNDGTEAGLDPAYSTNISGSEVVNYASQFVGNPYVWGGTSLTNGADCSGFIMSIFKHFGITLPHSSYLLRSCGKNVSYSNAKPGDIICYSGHVALYAGNGKIIGAQSSKVGIKYENATYKPIICVRRVL